MGGKRRDAAADRAAITAAAERLLTGTPLRSRTGRLTAGELAVEAGLRRDVVYQHADLVESYQAQVRVRDAVPEAMADLARELDKTREELQRAKEELAAERRTTAFLRRAVTELSIENEALRSSGRGQADVTPLAERRLRDGFTCS
ncbi:hypothetical protein ABZZ79_37230 [Streptomyces sp. NPDC006458]|uniref:hypothetical protein n=1 Tax=Streptomyces sp. NPDC006458 TaxID=3154302 RepID=UPI00339DFC1E